MDISLDRIRAYRLAAHHLDKRIPAGVMTRAAGACGLQNSPPGAWESALWNRLEGCSLDSLHDTLYRQKALLQAWSFRGVPAIFPTEARDVFLTALLAKPGEEPWIYTKGIGLALEYLRMDFNDLLPIVKRAAGYLNHHTVTGKEALDQILAETAQKHLSRDKWPLWQAPSMYGSPDKQTVGGAVVSFLLRPCSFDSLVVFGERQGVSPTFTSMKNWLGHIPEPVPFAKKELARRFLRCYGPATRGDFTSWLGCSPAQARRLWDAAADEMEPVSVEGNIRYVLAAEKEHLLCAEGDPDRLLLLDAHDPYLDLRDKSLILTDKSRQRTVWQTVSNPGAVIRGGRIVGIWKRKTMKDKLDISITLWETLQPNGRGMLENLAEDYAAFRKLQVRSREIAGG